MRDVGVSSHKAPRGDLRPPEAAGPLLRCEHEGGVDRAGRHEDPAADQEDLLPRLGPLLRLAPQAREDYAGGGLRSSRRAADRGYRGDGGPGPRVPAGGTWVPRETGRELLFHFIYLFILCFDVACESASVECSARLNYSKCLLLAPYISKYYGATSRHLLV